MHKLAGRGRIDSASTLAAAGASIEAVTDSGERPLHWAAYHACPTGIAWLLDQGAKINAADLTGQTPLHKTAFRPDWCKSPRDGMKGQAATAELLMARGADINAKDKKGRTPLELAKRNHHENTAKVLRDHGATE
jgi:ankyrin repeat protein